MIIRGDMVNAELMIYFEQERSGGELNFTNYLKYALNSKCILNNFLSLLVGYQKLDVPVSGEVSEAGER